MPLPHAAFKPPVQHPASGSSPGQRQQGLERSTSRFGSELWAPYLRDTALRVFGSVGVAGQLGHFCRPVLDFTAGAPLLPCLLCASALLGVEPGTYCYAVQSRSSTRCLQSFHITLVPAACMLWLSRDALDVHHSIVSCGHAVVKAACALRCSTTLNSTFKLHAS